MRLVCCGIAAIEYFFRPFLRAHIPLFLYPFLHTNKTTRPFEYLRLTSLGVIGALVKTDEPEVKVIQFLLSTEIIPLCLRIAREPSPRLMKHVVRCYSRLSDNSRALNTNVWRTSSRTTRLATCSRSIGLLTTGGLNYSKVSG